MPDSLGSKASPFARACWIWPTSHFWDLHNSYALFRKEFQLDSAPRRALFCITADQSYQLYINGRYVCRGPARGFQDRWPYDEVEIAPFLAAGRNVLAIRAHHPGFSNFQYLTQGFAGVLAAGKIGGLEIVSDASWKCRRQEGIRRDTVPSSVQLFSQEHADLRVEAPDWMRPEFDDAAWADQAVAVPWNSMPWHSLTERGIPLLDEREIDAGSAIGESEGSCAPGYREARDVTRLPVEEGISNRPRVWAAGPLLLQATGPGRWRRVLLDFGTTVVGSLGLRIAGARGGEIIDTLHVEAVEMANLSPRVVLQGPGNFSRPAFGHRLICREGRAEHVFYHPFGFRYCLLTIRDSSVPVTITPFLRTTLYPLGIEGKFRSSDPALNAIWDASVRTQQVCCLDAYVDTPWREQVQWWGDARVQAANTFHLADDPRLLRRGIDCLARQRTPDGLTYGHAPTIAHHCILADFSLTWLLTLWDHYWQTGSTEAFSTHHDAVDDILGYFQHGMDAETGLVRHDPRYRLFIDWTDLPRKGCPATLSLWLLLALEKMARLCTLTKRSREGASLRKWAAGLRKSLLRLAGQDSLLGEGYDERGKRLKGLSLHTQTLALMADLRSSSEAAILRATLLPFIREERSFPSPPSAYWITHVFSVLEERGFGAEVITFIRKHWAAMAEHGTTWESFHPVPGRESLSHAWSAHPISHFARILGGIRQTAPGWRSISYEPTFLGEACESVVPSPLGPIRSSWRRKGSRIDAWLDLPRNMSARVRLPGTPAATLFRSASWRLASPSAVRPS